MQRREIYKNKKPLEVTNPFFRVAPNLGIQGKSGNFICNKGNSGGKDRFSQELRKIKEVLELLLFHFRVLTASILHHTSSCVWQLPNFPRCYNFVLCIHFEVQLLVLWDRIFEESRLFKSPHQSKEMIRLSGKIKGK